MDYLCLFCVFETSSYICRSVIRFKVETKRHIDEKIIRDLERGEKQAFDYVFTTYYTDLCRFARAFIGSREAAEDVVSEVFVRIWERGVRLEKNRSLDSYLYVAVRNGCVSFTRKQKEFIGLEAVTQQQEDNPKPDEWGMVWKAVEGLPEQCRLILKLVVLEEMKYAEVAAYLEISVNTVKTQIKIAYRELRKEFSRQHLFLFFIFAGQAGY